MGARLQDPQFALPYETIIHGKYLVKEVLGSGGFGITYAGTDLHTNTDVAIKEYYPNGGVTRFPGDTKVSVHSDHETYMAGMDRFLQEARIIYHCKSNNLLNIYSLFEENGTAYYVMEFLQGDDLKHVLESKGRRISWKEFRPILIDVLNALEVVHKEGIIHRDISPDNIYICSDGHAKLIDFGTARQVFGNKSLSVILKKGYAPPEQYSSHGKQGAWTDIFALACTCYRSLSGIMPIESTERLRNDTLVNLNETQSDAPQYVNDAIMKGLELDENRRFQSAREFKRALIKESVFTDLLTTSSPKGKGGFSEVLERLKGKTGIAVNAKKAEIEFFLGPLAGQIVHLDKDISMGRDASRCDLVFPPNTMGVSRYHCQICTEIEKGKFFLLDCGSSFGTIVNGKRLTPGVPIELQSEDVITFGDDIGFVFRR